MDILLGGLKAAAEATRLRIIALCAHADLTVSEICQILGQSQPRVSRHLKLLVEGKILENHRETNWIYYRLNNSPDAPPLGHAIVDMIPDDDTTLAMDLKNLQGIRQKRASKAEQYQQQNKQELRILRELYAENSAIEYAIANAIPCDANSLLDLGTGTGRILELVADRIQYGVGIDMSLEMLAIARHNLESQGYRNCTVRHGDVTRLQLDKHFDAIVGHMILQYTDTPATMIKDAVHYLQDNGTLVIVDFAPHTEINIEAIGQNHQGFTEQDIHGFFVSSGLTPTDTTFIQGNKLDVYVWTAKKQSPNHIKD